MLYWGSYRILSFFLNLAHFHIILDNERALARQEDPEYYAEVHITTNIAPLEGISHRYNADKQRNVKKKKKVPKGDRENENKTNHPEGKKYVAVLLCNFLFPCGRRRLSGFCS